MNTSYPEKTFQQEVRQIARLYGWADYCPWNSRPSPAGWPDLTLLRPPHLIFAELKTNSGRLTPPQFRTINLLRRCQRSSAHYWQPAAAAQIHNTIAPERDQTVPPAPFRHRNHKNFEIPPHERFHTEAGRHSVFLHKPAHATGHPSRLARFDYSANREDIHGYAAENWSPNCLPPC